MRGHVLLCLPAWYLEWHLHRRLAPLLFEDEASAVRDSPVQKPQRSQQAKAKTATRTTPDGDPVHSLTTLLQDLATVTLNQVTLPGHPNRAFSLVTKATPLQAKLFRMLKIDPKVRCCHKQGRLIFNKLLFYNQLSLFCLLKFRLTAGTLVSCSI